MIGGNPRKKESYYDGMRRTFGDDRAHEMFAWVISDAWRLINFIGIYKYADDHSALLKKEGTAPMRLGMLNESDNPPFQDLIDELTRYESAGIAKDYVSMLRKDLETSKANLEKIAHQG